MSVLPDSYTYMAQAEEEPNQESETFQKFFECWIAEQSKYLEELVSASKQQERLQHHQQSAGDWMTQEEFDETVLRPLIERVLQHYEHYYTAKSRCAKNDILSMLSPSWRSTLEDAFLWIGGWRPSMAFHLLYSKSGQQIESRLDELIRGLNIGDLGDLSSGQIVQIDELQRNVIKEEKDITEKQAKQQETLADADVVELSHMVTEKMRQREGAEEGHAMEEGRVEAAFAPKEEGLAEILQMADDLRLKTLKEVINILTPLQAVQFLIAAAELHLRVHEWGRRRDAQRRHSVGEGWQS